jgi:hypothetical protein
MPAKDPEERKLIARVAAQTQWAKCPDRAARTEAARAALWQRFLDEVDPDGVLDPNERERRALHARKAYYTRIALKSRQSRVSKERQWIAEAVAEMLNAALGPDGTIGGGA